MRNASKKSCSSSAFSTSSCAEKAKIKGKDKRQREKANSRVVHVVQLRSLLERLSDCRTVCLISDFSSFAMRRSWVRIPSRPPDSKNLHHLWKRPILKINLGDKPLNQTELSIPLSFYSSGDLLAAVAARLIGQRTTSLVETVTKIVEGQDEIFVRHSRCDGLGRGVVQK